MKELLQIRIESSIFRSEKKLRDNIEARLIVVKSFVNQKADFEIDPLFSRKQIQNPTNWGYVFSIWGLQNNSLQYQAHKKISYF